MANLGKLFATLNQTYADSGIARVSQIFRDLVLQGCCYRACQRLLVIDDLSCARAVFVRRALAPES